MSREWIALVAIAGLTLLAYMPALRGGLIWDDDAHITAPALRSLEGLRQIWFVPGATQQYYPVLHSAFWIEHKLWGDHPLGYHLITVLLHAGAAGLILALVRRLGLPGGWLAALIFALHPVCVESVAWISEQKNTLSTVFTLTAAVVYLGFDQRRRPAAYALATALFLLALGTKTVVATLPASLLVMFWWMRGTLGWRRDVVPLLPWFVLSACAGVGTAWVEREMIGAQGAEFTLSGIQRVLIAGRAIWFYLGKLLWPSNLTFIYPRWEVSPAVAWQYLFPAAVIVVVVVLGWIAVRRGRRGPLAAFLVFSGTLFPALGFVNIYPFRYSFVADHFQYLASIGIFIPAAGLIARALSETAAPRRNSGIIAALLICGLGLLTWRQSAMYRDAETVYRVTLERNPTCWMAHGNLGSLLARAPETKAEARMHLEAALALNPESPRDHYSMAILLAEDPAEIGQAIEHCRAAIRLEPAAPAPHNALGALLVQFPDRVSEAVGEYEIARTLRPADARTRYNLAAALLLLPGREDEAMQHMDAAVRLAPEDAVLCDQVGFVLAGIPGRVSEAVAYYRRAVQLRPGFTQARYHLALTLLSMRDGAGEAAGHLEIVARENPTSPEVHYNLGVARVKGSGPSPDAVADFEQAVRLRPAFPEAHFALALALSDTPGRQAEARSHAETALRIDPAHEPARRWLALMYPAR